MQNCLHFSFQIPRIASSAPKGMRPSIAVAVSIPLFFFAAVAPTAEPQQPLPALVKVAAVQMLGYDKTDVPRPGFDPSEAVVRYIEKAATRPISVSVRSAHQPACRERVGRMAIAANL